MARQYLCAICGHTTVPTLNGICRLCQRRTADKQRKVPHCLICGKELSSGQVALCDSCRELFAEQITPDKLDGTIKEAKADLQILELRQSGLSFKEIAKVMGISSSAAFHRLTAAVFRTCYDESRGDDNRWLEKEADFQFDLPK